jgi:hypothetical protein
MWRKACPWSTGALVVALILVAWRLKTVETELDRVRDELADARTPGPVPGSAEPSPAADGAPAAGPTVTPVVASEASEMAVEWEQAVPPMDS